MRLIKDSYILNLFQTVTKMGHKMGYKNRHAIEPLEIKAILVPPLPPSELERPDFVRGFFFGKSRETMDLRR